MNFLTALIRTLVCLLLLVSAPRAEAQGYDQSYERRAQDAVAGLIRLNGLRGPAPNVPDSWPEASPKTGVNFTRPVFAAAWNREAVPAYLDTLIAVNQNLQRAANLGGLTRLRHLELYGNGLKALNLENNPALEVLRVTKNQLGSLNLSDNQRLEILAASNNKLRKLDTGSNTALRELYVSMNQIEALDLSRNRRLSTLEAMNNDIAELDVSKCPDLTRLLVAHNRLGELDLSANPGLVELRAANNKLKKLDLAQNHELVELTAGRNQFGELDLKNLTRLTRLSVEHNELTSLDISRNPALVNLEAQNNPLTEVILGDNELAALETINLDGCRLPLSSLAPLSGVAGKRARLGNQQTVIFESARVTVGESLDLSSQAVIEGATTEFSVWTDKKRRVKPNDYSLNNGRITFHHPGRYQVVMTNDRVYSTETGQTAGRDRTFKVKASTGLIEVVPSINQEKSADQ